MATGLISIKEQYADAILGNYKRVEFRKMAFPVDVTRLLLYVTKPTGLIVGECRLLEQIIAHPSELWERFRNVGAVETHAFHTYYARRQRAVGLLVGDARRYDTPLTLEAIGEFNGPPLSMKTIKDLPDFF